MKQYEVTYKLWWKFCNNNNISLFKVSIEQVLNFLQFLVDKKYKYGTINSHKSALSFLQVCDFEADGRVKKFMKGVSNLNPSEPRYTSTWDPDIVLMYLKTLGPNENMSIKMLTLKLATLIALATGQRIQTISVIRITNIKEQGEKLQIFITDKIKTSGLNRKQPCLQLPFLPDEPLLCAARTIKDYMKRTESLRIIGNDQLFLTHQKPFKPANKQTISRWIKETLQLAGVDTSTFKPHSVRHASTSSALKKGITLENILNTAGWSRPSTFTKFYLREVRNEDCFAKTVLTPQNLEETKSLI